MERARVMKRLAAFCESRVPPIARDKVRVGYRVQRGDVLVFEERPEFHDPRSWREMPVAEFRYVASKQVWRLYCMHRDLRWHAYQELPSAARFETLLDEVAEDPTGIFWGCRWPNS